jgi:uncharacterized protein (DUF849 family)
MGNPGGLPIPMGSTPLLRVALNGARTAAERSAVLRTPGALAREARTSVEVR